MYNIVANIPIIECLTVTIEPVDGFTVKIIFKNLTDR